jgi:nucleotide-binding universal stress UspA family protein
MVAPNRSIDSVLLPTDGSEGALTGAARGIELAIAVDADIHVLSVIDTPDSVDVRTTSESSADTERLPMEIEVETAVETIAMIARDWNEEIDVTTFIDWGDPSRVISNYADEYGTDLIVMGTVGRSGFERFLLGSVTENVLRTARVPVLAVPPERDDLRPIQQRYDDILLPTDGSEGATAAIGWGIFMATVSDAMLHSLYSVDTSRFPSSQEASEILSTLEQTGKEALETVRERARDSDVPLSASLTSGQPAKVILAYVDSHEIDLIVMGTHGRSAVMQRFLGSVTENVVRNADVPVLCIPRGREE